MLSINWWRLGGEGSQKLFAQAGLEWQFSPSHKQLGLRHEPPRLDSKQVLLVKLCIIATMVLLLRLCVSKAVYTFIL
jgi:hypothetical protein